jgi:predicted nucleic acid-binding protein
MIVISDTTPLISLVKINQLELVGDLFGEIQIPEAVYKELVSNLKYKDEADKIKSYKKIKRVKVGNESSVQLLRRATGLDIGESEAIILSDQIKADLLLMDEVKGRQVAKNMGINIMGTIGILVQAYESRLLSKGQIEECIEVLRDNGRHISDRLYEQLLDRINKKI